MGYKKYLLWISILVVSITLNGCSNSAPKIKSGAISGDQFVISDLGLSIKFDPNLMRPTIVDTLNRARGYSPELVPQFLEFRQNKEAFLIGFQHKALRNEIFISVINLEIEECKDYILSKMQKTSAAQELTLIAKFSEMKMVETNQNQFHYLIANYSFEEFPLIQKSTYAFKQIGDIVLQIEVPEIGRMVENNMGEEIMLNLLNNINID